MSDGIAGRRPRGRPSGAAAMVLVALAAVLAAPTGAAISVSHDGGPAGPAAGGGFDWTTLSGSNNRSGFSPLDGPPVPDIIAQIASSSTNPPAVRTGVVTNGSWLWYNDALGNVYAFNREYLHTRNWTASVGGAPVTPALYGNVLYAMGDDGMLTAFNSTNGRVIWQTALGGVPAGGLAVATTATGTLVIVGLTDGFVLGVSASNGGLVQNLSAGGPVAGAVAIEGALAVVATTSGHLTAYNLSTRPASSVWTATAGASLDSGPAVSYGLAAVGDLSGNLTAFHLTDGSEAWRTSVRTVLGGDTLNAAPAIGDGHVFVATQLGAMIAYDVFNGTMAWNRTATYTGYYALASPTVAPNGVYFSDADQDIVDLVPQNGSVVWSYSLGFAPEYGTPAIDGGDLLVGSDLGLITILGRPGGPVLYPVTGTVRSAQGAPIAGALVLAGTAATASNTTGAFEFKLANGTYAFQASNLTFYPTFTNVTVAGPVSGISLVLQTVPRAWVYGTIVDADTGQPLAGVSATFYENGITVIATSAANGSFAIQAPIGPDSVFLGPSAGYGGISEVVDIPATGLSGLVIALPPVYSVSSDVRTDGVLFSLAAISCALASAAVYGVTRRRESMGQPTGLLGPFGRFVLMRAILVPIQAVAILTVLYVFGTTLPALARNTQPCTLVPSYVCNHQLWSWGNPGEASRAFLYGLGWFLWNLFTGNWGVATFGHLTQPAWTFLTWWLPFSVQLALFALPMSAALAWVIGLYGGSKRDGPVDVGARVLSAAGLLVPSFLLVILFLGSFYTPFTNAFGDSPYGILPTTAWWQAHGGIPSWIGQGGNTLPAPLPPLVDGAIHGDWAFEKVVLVKTLWQAAAIAVVYTAIFLRYARSVVAEAFQEPHLVAARARGIDDHTILWRHTGRRVLPLFVLVFGVTLPAYVGTQSVVEALANDPGLGTLLLGELTHVGMIGFGFSQTANLQSGNLYQVMIFLLVLFVLVGNLFSDVLARYLDPRLLRRAP